MVPYERNSGFCLHTTFNNFCYSNKIDFFVRLPVLALRKIALYKQRCEFCLYTKFGKYPVKGKLYKEQFVCQESVNKAF